MSEISRRGVLGAAVAGLALAPFADPAQASAADTAPRGPKTRRRRNLYARSRFELVRGKRFRLTGAGGSASSVRLVGVSDIRPGVRGDTHQFALTFRANRTGPPQGTYTVRRRGFAPTALFVVPDAAQRTYQAVVNRAP
jgi:uncharacterized protein DUF6916